MVLEAVAMKIRVEDEKAQEQQERKDFKKDKSRLNKFR